METFTSDSLIRLFTVTVALTAVTLLPIPGAAQVLEEGTWTGTMTPPEGGDAPVTYDVSRGPGGLEITMTVEGMDPRPLRDIRLEDDVLRFTFDMGVEVTCNLTARDGGGFAGPCGDEDRQAGRLTMTPGR